MKTRNILLVAWIAGLLWGGGARAEYRTWTGQDGKTVNAEYVRKVGTLVVLHLKDNSEFKIDYGSLSAEDRQVVDLQNPPQLDLRASFQTDTRTIGYIGTDENSYRLIYEIIKPFVTVKKTAAEPYTASLVMELVVVGKSLETERYVVLDHFTEQFTFAEENKNQFTCETDPIDLQRTQDGLRTGLEYYGYVLAVRDDSGGIVALKTNHTNLQRHAVDLLAAEPKSQFNRQMRLVRPGSPGGEKNRFILWRWF